MKCINCGQNNFLFKDLFWSRKTKPVECSNCHVKIFVPSTLSSAYLAFILDILGLLLLFLVKDKFNLTWLSFALLVLLSLTIVRLGDFLLLKPQDINNISSAKNFFVSMIMVSVICGFGVYLYKFL